MYHNAIKIYNTLLYFYFDDYDNITEEGKEKMGEIKGYRFIESKKEDAEKSKPQSKETIAEREKFKMTKSRSLF